MEIRKLLTAMLPALLLVLLVAGAQPTTAQSGDGAPSATQNGPALNVDANNVQRPISPHIYGINFASEAQAEAWNLSVNRWGGNATTRYNWQLDVSNRASDWFFLNVPNEVSDPDALPHGSSSDQFVEQNQRTGSDSLLTIPLIGWTPKSRNSDCGFRVSLYGPQQATEPWHPDCGNGVASNGSPITGNNPADTSRAIDPEFVRQWLQHLTGKYGRAGQGGVTFYNLDNEPMLWHETHRDVHPLPASYDEVRDRTLQYAPVIKEVDPGAQVLGPTVWGWTAYFYSALDQAAGGDWWNNPVDRTAHGGTPFVPWYLQEMQAYEQQHGKRILDYLDLHYYPQQAGVSLAPAGDAQTQVLRLRSTRALWDPTYVDESWINEPVQLIPRMRQWVNAHYPGTKLALTEYNWGALDHVNGALAQADVLGIFGREGLDLATLWDPPQPNQPGAFAFRMYRNYDGQGSTFGDQSLAASSGNQDQLAVYAARRSSDNALTIMVINKSGVPLQSQVAINGLDGGSSAQVYRYSAANLQAIEHAPDQPFNGGVLQATFPGQSITLFVVGGDDGGANPAPPPPENLPPAVFLPVLSDEG